MILKIGEKIKRQREKNNITQNKMADYLGITEQAISRWENGGGYPDMEMIPAISNFLNISIDELFEADKKAERLSKIKTDIIIKYANGFIGETIEMCRSALKEFPNDYKLMYYLFTSLQWDFANNRDEFIELGKRIINDCGDYEIKMKTISEMARTDFADDTKKLAENLPNLQFSINISKEKALSFLGDKEERIKYKKSMVMIFGREFCNEINSLADAVSEAKESIAIREKAIQILNIIFETGDYGKENISLHKIYRSMASDYMCMGENEKALDCLEKAADYCIAAENNIPVKYTSLLPKDIDKGIESHVFIYNHGSPATISYSFIHDFLLKEDIYAPISEVERFKLIIANLEKYARAEKVK